MKFMINSSFIVYVVALLFLLFLGTTGVNRSSGISQASFVPFATIMRDLTRGGHGMRNLLGNLFLLFPIGLYGPYLVKMMQKFWFYVIVVVLLIVSIEVIQYITNRGILDIDDFILNFSGAVIGFLVFVKFRPDKKSKEKE